MVSNTLCVACAAIVEFFASFPFFLTIQRSPGIFSGQTFPGLVVRPLRGRDVGLHVSAKQVFVGLRPNVLNHVTHAQNQLILDGWHPGVVIQLQDGARTEEIQLADGGREDGETVALEVQLPQVMQLPDLGGDIYKLVVPEGQDPEIAQVADLGGEHLKVVVTARSNRIESHISGDEEVGVTGPHVLMVML